MAKKTNKITKKTDKGSSETNKGGRPKVIDSEELREKIRESASFGLSIPLIALDVGIAKSTLYDYLKKNHEFSDELHLLMDNPKLIARKNVMRDMKSGNLDTSKWYLEKRDKSFNPKQLLEHSGKTEVVNSEKSIEDYIREGKEAGLSEEEIRKALGEE
jgi:IS30 family transposase